MGLKFQSDYLYSDVIPHHARFSANRPAVVCAGERLTWAQLELRTRKVANALGALGLRKGDKVCLFMHSSIAAFELFWGTIRAGGVVVALNVLMARDSLTLMINNSDAKWLFTDAANLDQIARIAQDLQVLRREHIYVSGDGAEGWASAAQFVDSGGEAPVDVEIGPQDSINIVYTSGTTGVPKGIEHSHLARHSYTFGMGHYFNFDASSVALLATPLYTNGTWMTMAPCMFRGGCCVLMPKFGAGQFLEAVQNERCTHAFLVPTQIVTILEHPELDRYDTSSLKIIESAGQPLMSKTFDELHERLPHAALWEVYGMSEGFCTIAGPADWARGKRGSVGKPVILDDIRIIDADGRELPVGEIGEICGYSLGLMDGYYKDPIRTEEMIWRGPRGRTYLRSGDLGRLDSDGYLYVSGRAKDMIKSGGINIYPADIESIFTQHPAVSEACAIGVPHPKWMETPLLFVILREGFTLAADELMSWGNERLSKYQRVSAVQIITQLPRVTYGKVDKKTLRAPYWAGRERDI